MFPSTDEPRHLVFFSELASLEEQDPGWRAVSGGLVVLRLVDAWVREGAEAVAGDSWGVRSVRAAVEEMPRGLPARAILSGVVDALVTAPVGDGHAVMPRLMAYARSLDIDGRWTLAADVYETVIAYADPDTEGDVVVHAQLRLGHCFRQAGALQVAKEAFAEAFELAESRADVAGMLRAQLGEAKVRVAVGNLSGADRLLEETARAAMEAQLSEIRSMATHERVFIASSRGDLDLAVRLAYDALDDAIRESERDRILNDLAVSLSALGVKSAARDAFLILAATAHEQYIRWAATINLMELAADDGAELRFEAYRQELMNEPLNPMMRAQFELHAGLGFRSLGDEIAADLWLGRARQTAVESNFNQLVFAIDRALTERTNVGDGARVTSPDTPSEEVTQIAREIRQWRELSTTV